MKKVIAMLLVFLALGTVVFAGGFSLRGGFAYDFANIKIADTDGTTWKTNSFGAEFGITYNFSDKFLLYGDSGIGFFSKFKINDAQYSTEGFDKTSFITDTSHAGAAFNINLKKGLDLQVGGGFAFEYIRAISTTKISDSVSESDEFGVYGIGFGLYANIDYKLSEKFAVCATVHPDFLVVSGYTAGDKTTTVLTDKSVLENSTTITTVGGAFSFKFNASVGAKFIF